jgi:hypothetical protein
MIAVYYNDGAGPFTMYALPVAGLSKKDFIDAMEEYEYPAPTADIIFIDYDSTVIFQSYIEGLK